MVEKNDKIWCDKPKLNPVFGYYKYYSFKGKFCHFLKTGRWISRVFVPGIVGRISGEAPTFTWIDEVEK